MENVTDSMQNNEKRARVLQLVKDIYTEGYHCGIKDDAIFEQYSDEIIAIFQMKRAVNQIDEIMGISDDAK